MIKQMILVVLLYFCSPLAAPAKWPSPQLINPLSQAEEDAFTRIFKLEAQNPKTLKEFKLLKAQGAHVILKEHMVMANRTGNLPLVKWLHKEGAPLYIEDPRYGMFPEALQSGNMKLIQWWIAQGVDIYKAPASVFFGTPYPAVAEWAISQGIKPPQDLEERTYILSSLAERGELPMIRWLVEKQDWRLVRKNTLDNITSWTEGPLLIIAARSGKREMIEWLIQQGLPFDKPQIKDYILIKAVQSKNLAFVKWLHSKGAVINPQKKYWEQLLPNPLSKKDGFAMAAAAAPPSRYSSPLLEAVELNDIDMVKWLIKQGAKTAVEQVTPDFSKEPPENIDIAHYACKRNYTKLSNLLFILINSRKKNCVQQFTKSKTISGHYKEMYGIPYFVNRDQNLRIQKRIRNGFPFQLKDQQNDVLIRKAVDAENLSLTKYLVKKGTDLSHKDYFRNTLLHTAAGTANRTIMSYLLTQGLNINGKNSDGQTPLAMAVRSGDIDAVEFSLNSGAQIQGSGAIESAQEFKYKRIEHLLKDALHKEAWSF